MEESYSLKFLFESDGSLDKQRLSWITEPQKNALIMELHLNCQQLRVENSILRGKCHTYEITLKAKDSNNKRLNQELAQAELDLYDLKYRGGKK